MLHFSLGGFSTGETPGDDARNAERASAWRDDFSNFGTSHHQHQGISWIPLVPGIRCRCFSASRDVIPV